jgi:hypothetical protein
MALLAKAPSTLGLDCNGVWVTFSCTGDFASRDAANRNFESAQLALLTNSNVAILVDDTKKHNNYCFSERIELFPPQ